MKREHLSDCSFCGATIQRLLLHNVRHRGIYRLFCTACVLNNFPGSFCPICFQVYLDDQLPPLQERAMCLKCPSISHLSCVALDVSPRSECFPCKNPNFPLFDLNLSSSSSSSRSPSANTIKVEVADGESVEEIELRRGFDKDSAKKFLAAAKIAFLSVSKAAAAARADAEKKVEEATLAKKEAKEAMGHVADIVYQEIEVDALLLSQILEQDQIVGAEVGVDDSILGLFPGVTESVQGVSTKIGLSIDGNDKHTGNVQGVKYSSNWLSPVSPSGRKSQHQQSTRHGN